jgi:hypothetical protein
MKKLLMLTLVVLFVCSITTNAAGISLGLKGGLAIANLSGAFIEELEEEIEADLGSKMVFAGGVFVDIGFSEMIGLQPEILYISKGAKAEEAEGSVTMNLTYLEIPLLLKLKIPASPLLTFQILAGPTIGMNLGAKGVIEATGEETQEEDFKDDIKLMDMGVSFGAGVGIGLGSSGILTLDGRYTMGLVSIAEDAGEEAKTNYISIMAGYAFSL